MRRVLVASGLVSRCTVAHRRCSAKPAGGNAKLDDLAATYAQLTLKEVSDLQRLIFKKLGHSDDFYEKALLRGLGGGGGGGAVMMAPAAAAAAAAPAADAAADGADTAKVEKKKVEKLTFDVKLEKYAPEIKTKLIKELRSVTTLSIADAKKAVEKCPGLVATNMSKADAEKLKDLYEKLGAKVELI
ncbi:60S ribosomal protein [Novymonas esmeraldas]|uniref:60S ribosomal protein n=1 Tax=Novymonas esmeraldas TaxID=1808958 RepID=A0AAW0EQS9_9TRYP